MFNRSLNRFPITDIKRDDVDLRLFGQLFLKFQERFNASGGQNQSILCAGKNSGAGGAEPG